MNVAIDFITLPDRSYREIRCIRSKDATAIGEVLDYLKTRQARNVSQYAILGRLGAEYGDDDRGIYYPTDILTKLEARWDAVLEEYVIMMPVARLEDETELAMKFARAQADHIQNLLNQAMDREVKGLKHETISGEFFEEEIK